MGIYKVRFIERLHGEAQLVKKPPSMDKNDPRIGFHADANPVRSGAPELYGLDLFKSQLDRPRLSWEPDK